MTLKNSIHIMVLAIAVMALAGCATMEKVKSVAAGDRVAVRFTCRLKNGEIAISTEKKVADDPALPKSALFMPRDQDGPLMIYAEIAAQNKPDDLYASFEDRVVKRIAGAVVGMVPGEERTVTITAQREDAYLKPEEIFLKMSRVRHRPKEVTIASAEFASRMGKAPVVGEEVALEDGLPARVISVEGDMVALSIAALSGRQIRTPFGVGTIRETPDDVVVEIDARVGTLVRSGPLAGRISAFDDTTFTLDYGHPFGGEELACDVAVAPATKVANQGDHHAEK